MLSSFIRDVPVGFSEAVVMLLLWVIVARGVALLSKNVTANRTEMLMGVSIWRHNCPSQIENRIASGSKIWNIVVDGYGTVSFGRKRDWEIHKVLVPI